MILKAARARPASRPPPAAGRAAARAIKALEARFGPGAETLEMRWPEIVGETLARRCEPVRLVKTRSGERTLEVRVAGAYATLIQHQADDLLARVNLFLGKDRADRLRLVQGPLRGASGASGGRPGRKYVGREGAGARRSMAAEAPLDAAREAELAAGLSSIRDEALKEALRRLGRGVLRRGAPSCAPAKPLP